ncbi:MAG TPA: hypothetical protein VG204_09525 [Terriglobia bacterium]|nr:hypothetical protein [Terriglobia bacterium]
MRRSLLVIVTALVLVRPAPSALPPQQGNADQSSHTPGRLTNSDIVEMTKAGLSAEIIVAKIQTSASNFDTSPAALKELKASGVSEAVILTMVKSPNQAAPKEESAHSTPPARPQTVSPQGTETVKSGTETPEERAVLPTGYQISYVKSDRKWKYGLRSEPYDKVSEYLQSKLVEALETKGLRTVANLEGGCCRISIELLEVTTHPAAFKKPGVDASANITIEDAHGKHVYSKGYRGESRTMMNTYGHLIDHACEDLVKNIVSDETFVFALSTGKLQE